MPVKGVNFSIPSTFIEDQSGFPTNMMYSRGEMKKRPGKTLQGAVIADGNPILGLGRLELPGNVRYIVRASQKKLEVLNTGTGNWDSISGTDFTGDNANFFSFTNVTEDELLLISNGFDKIRKYSGSGNASALGGNPPNAKYMTYLSPYVLIANLTDSGNELPWKVQWPDTGTPETWTGGNSGSDLIADEPSAIQNIVKLNEFAAVYKEESLVLGRKVDPPDVFRFDTIKTGIGLASPRCVVDDEGTHFFMDSNDFYMWNGIRVESIGEAIRDEAFALMDPDKFDRCFAIHIKALEEIWFFVVNVGSSWPQHVWKYKHKLGFWYQDTCDSITAAARWRRTSTIAWNDTTGTWDSQNTVWNASSTVEAWEEIMFGDSSGKCLKLDYTTTNDNFLPVNSHYVTKDFVADDLEVNERWLQLDTWVYGPGKIYVDYSTDFGSNWTNIPYTSAIVYAQLGSVVQKIEWYFDIWAPQIRFRLRNAEISEQMIIQSIAPYYLKREEVWTRR